jgi:nitrogenase iron protein
MNRNGDRAGLRLAIYGKGGIGKSTIAANLAAAFATMGKSVLQIGCDPKHDSTRLLLGGQTIETVLQHLENPTNQADMIRFRRNLMSPDRTVAEVVAAGRGLPEGLERQNVLHTGFGGVLCIEAGGPRPGVGCAGRGIITTFELLQKLRVDPAEFDVVLYDVLGDVVCGGFGVPLRHEHANAILLVTSEEYMPIFAANNILRGVKTYDRQQRRLTGLFLNRRDNSSSRSLVNRFAEVAQLPVVAELPRSAVVQSADHLGETLAEAFAETPEAAVFRNLAERLLDGSSPRYVADPMTDEELEATVLRRQISNPQSLIPNPTRPKPRVTTGEPRRLAIYGKGGIGKSTIAANISATLASRGMRVLQIGCDPKHDSTRLLLDGRTVRTVLEYLRDVCEADRRLDEVVHQGLHGVDCVEVGGPEPGIGCAGRGILSAFTLLEKLGLREHDYDAIVYDVLGDVVCGGFAIPLRKGYAQSVLIVTSEEYMPLYAANNILRGINGVAGIEPRVLGIFHNVRDNDADLSTTGRFALAVSLPIVAWLERSKLIQDAEQRSSPLAAFAPESDEFGVFDRLVTQLLQDSPHHPAMPLDDSQLDQIVLGRSSNVATQPATTPVRANGDGALDEPSTFTQAPVDLHFCNFEQAPSEPYFYRKKPIRQPIWGCAFQAAVRTALRLRDAVVVAHAPRSCVHMCRSGICTSASKDLKRRGKFRIDPLEPNLVSTDMTVPHMIYGGTELLTQTLKNVLLDKPPVVFLATACPPAIIGDDVVDAIRQAQPISPGTRIIPLRTDGNMTGGGANGHLSALFDGLLSVVETAPDGPVQARCVNLLGDWTHEQSRTIRGILNDVGVSVNTSFSVNDRNPRVEDLRRMNLAPLTLMGAMNFGMLAVAKHLRERFNTQLATYPFPRGFRETAIWLREIGDFFGLQDPVERYLALHEAEYQATVSECRKVLAGKRIVVFAGQPADWILDVMLDCGIEIPLVAVMARREDIYRPLRYEDKLPMEFSFHPNRRREVYDKFKPDAVLAGARHDLPDDAMTLDTVGVTEEDIGFGVEQIAARRWANLLATGLREQWRRNFAPHDKRLMAMGRGGGGGFGMGGGGGFGRW